jgi:nucleoid DNA-binding protein
MSATKAKRMTKAQIVAELAGSTGLSKKEISAVFDGLRSLVKAQLSKKGPGEFVIPELQVKLRVVNRPARKGVKRRNPATGEEIIKDEAASRKVRATPLKKLKEMVL